MRYVIAEDFVERLDPEWVKQFERVGEHFTEFLATVPRPSRNDLTLALAEATRDDMPVVEALIAELAGLFEDNGVVTLPLSVDCFEAIDYFVGCGLDVRSSFICYFVITYFLDLAVTLQKYSHVRSSWAIDALVAGALLHSRSLDLQPLSCCFRSLAELARFQGKPGIMMMWSRIFFKARLREDWPREPDFLKAAIEKYSQHDLSLGSLRGDMRIGVILSDFIYFDS